jgi:cell division FtsZ-interacting protein ZapD
MNENIGENSVVKNEVSVDNEAFKNLAGNLLKNEKSMGSLMNLATTFLKNDSLLNSIETNGNLKKTVSKDVEEQEDKVTSLIRMQENLAKQITLEISSLSQKLDTITDDISELKKEWQSLKEHNRKLFKKSKRKAEES